MTAQEQQMIQSLADRINGTSLAEKDPDAEQFLQQALGSNADALYILAQTTLVQQYALEQAQKQLADTRAQLEQARQPKHATSFLGNLLGHNENPPPPPPRQTYPPQYTPAPNYSQPYTAGGSSFSSPGYSTPPPPPYGQPQYGQPQYGQPQYGPPQSGGFLRSAAQTAAGVAAGALAFEGIESLMHGFGGSGGSSFGSGMGGGRPEEIINNNYYGDSGSNEHLGEHNQLSSDIEDRRPDSGSFDDAVNRGDHNYGSDNLLDSTGTDNTDNSMSANSDDTGFQDNNTDGSSFDDGSNDASGNDSSSFDDGN